MPESRIGLDNPNLSGRARSFDRSAHFSRRPIQPQARRGIDGFAIPKPLQPIKHTVASVQQVEAQTVPTNRASAPQRTSVTPKPALPRQARSAVLARHAVQPKAKKRSKRSKQFSKTSIMLVSMAFFVFLGGAFVSYLGWKTNKKAAAQVEVLSSTVDNEGDVPAEDEVTADAVASYFVAPDLPRFIKISRIGVNARVKRLGVKASGALAAPSNIYDAGWYDGSSKPREGGTTLIDGHVHGPTKPGVFYRLSNLKQGDTIEIERGDGQLFTYNVVSMETVDQDKVDMAKALVSIEPGKGALNLITCTGRYDVRTNKYEQRLVVYAVQK